MDLGLEGKTVVVTGGSEGIGLAIARAFKEEGAHVFIGARGEDKLERARSEYGFDIFRFDALESDGFYALSDYAYSLTGRLDVWVNNVGASRPRSAGTEYTKEDIDWTEAMCFDSAVHGSQAAFRHMKETGGAICNISSLAARVGTAGRSTLYGPLKAAVVMLSKNLAAEYAPYGIRVNAVMPGFTETEAVRRGVSMNDKQVVSERTLIPRMAEPYEIACPVVFLCSDRASYITGTSLEVSGGRDVVLNPSIAH